MYAEINNEERKNEDYQDNVLRFNKSKGLHIPWFEKYLPYEYRGIRIPDFISVNRDRGIVACIFHIVSSIAGFSFYFIRRNRLYLFINIFSLLVAFMGFYGTLTLKKWVITAHAMTTLALFGSVCVYSVIESFFNESLNSNDARGVDSKNYTETHIILLLAIPYLIDFLTGLMTFYLATLVHRFEDERDQKRERQERPEFELQAGINLIDRKCLICMANDKNAVFYNCGHKMSCLDCAKDLMLKYQPRCPLCRAKIIDVIQEFD